VDEEMATELAKRLCAAVMSYQMGMGMDSFYRRYLAQREKLGGIWYDIAELALRIVRPEMRSLLP
jgi:hypothetical protein